MANISSATPSPDNFPSIEDPLVEDLRKDLQLITVSIRET